MKGKSGKTEFLIESAWEVCNQVGGIYTVIRSKILSQQKRWGENYLLVGPYFGANHEFEEIEYEDSPTFRACQKMRDNGIEVHYGTWLVSGRPKTVLINPHSIFHKLGDIKFEMWESFDIPSTSHNDLLDQVLGCSYLNQWFIHELAKEQDKINLTVHFHEWMVGLAVPYLRRSELDIKIIFTTHATLLGRYLAMSDSNFYDKLYEVNWYDEAVHFDSLTQVKIERAAAHGATIFTTVSDITARECIFLLGRKPEVITPNGINIQRFGDMQHTQGMHAEFKQKINDFVIGHFFPSYKFNLDKTVYFFTSGRFEFKNKGYDITLEALARLNHLMHEENIDMNVVFFIVTKQPTNHFNIKSLTSRTMMEELKTTCNSIEGEISKKLFETVAGHDEDKLPDLNQFVEDHMRLKFRRIMQSSKTDGLPPVCTHNLHDDSKDEVLGFLRESGLINKPEDKVKIVYHPDFISITNPLFHMEYDQFVRGCHLGVFPSYYEPWGYTPVECLLRGVSAITSDLAGFGDYAKQHVPEEINQGLWVVDRNGRSFHEAADQLAFQMLSFLKLNRRERIAQRNRVEQTAQHFDWTNLIKFYNKAYDLHAEND